MASARILLITAAFFSLVWPTSTSWAKPASKSALKNGGKLTACTATIGSTDERELFKKHLNPRDFEFVELTEVKPPKSTQAPNLDEDEDEDEEKDQNWFRAACEQKIHCDLLIISGHFASGFFSDETGLALNLETLEKHACKDSCSGILNSPKEVFLFGCNTLATKEADHRTEERYVEVLVNDGIPRATAQRIAEDRYDVLGASNKERMQQVFTGAPHLYGFSSTGPKGKDIKSFLKNYLKKKPDYADHLVRQSVTELTTGLLTMNQNQGIPALRPNLELAQSLKPFSFAQCSGIFPWDPESERKRLYCELRDNSASPQTRLKLIQTLLRRPDSQYFLRTIIDILPELRISDKSQTIPPELRPALAQLAEDPVISRNLRTVLSKTQSAKTRLKLLQLARTLTLLPDQELRLSERETLRPFLKDPITEQKRHLICRITTGVKRLHLESSDFPPDWESRPEWLELMSCLRPYNHPIQSRLLELSLNSKGANTLQAQTAFRRLITVPELKYEILEQLERGETDTIQSIVNVIFNSARPEEARWTERLLAHAKSNQPTLRYRSMVILEALPSLAPEEQALAVKLALSDPDSKVQNQAIAALSHAKLSMEEQERISRLLQHPDASVRENILHTLSSSEARAPVVLERLYQATQAESDSSLKFQLVGVLGHLASKSPEARVYAHRLAANLKRDRSVELAILDAIETLQIYDETVIEAIHEGVQLSKDPDFKIATMGFLQRTQADDPRTVRYAKSLLESAQLMFQTQAVGYFAEKGSTDPQVLARLRLLTGPKQPSWISSQAQKALTKSQNMTASQP